MENSWFYLEGGERRGPVGVEELAGALLRAQEPHRVLVWREGVGDWREAGSFPEISRMLPPPRPMIQPQALPAIPFDQAESIARFYRRLVLLVGAQLLFGFLQVPAAAAGASSSFWGLLLVLLYILLIAVGVSMVVTAYRLAREMGEAGPILWAIGMFLPCLNLLVLLVLSSKAQSWCRQYGIKVGLLGPSMESIEELRRRGMTSHFE